LQASADLSILNFDIPYSITFVVSVAIDIVVTIYIMVLVTWPVLIVAIPAMVASKYVQVYQLSYFSVSRPCLDHRARTFLIFFSP